MFAVLQCFQCCERWDPHAGVERKIEGLHADRPVGRADDGISSPQRGILLSGDGWVHPHPASGAGDHGARK